jgi:hypothetical protein
LGEIGEKKKEEIQHTHNSSSSHSISVSQENETDGVTASTERSGIIINIRVRNDRKQTPQFLNHLT